MDNELEALRLENARLKERIQELENSEWPETGSGPVFGPGSITTELSLDGLYVEIVPPKV